MSAAPHTVPVPQPEIAPPPAHASAPERRSRKWLILLILLIVGGIVLWRVLEARKQPAQPAAGAPAVRTAVAATGSLGRTLRVAGQTSAIEFANITAPIMRGRESGSEMILLKVADGGTWVKKGSLVAQIDGQAALDHIEDLGDTIEAARADIRKRKAEHAIDWENLQQNIRIAKADLDKNRLEYKASEVLTEIQRQLAKLSLDESEAKYKQLQADLASKKLAHAADIRILELTLLRHNRHRDRHVRDLKAFSIYAPMDGLVVMQQTFRGSEFGQIQQGDRVQPGQTFMKIVNTKTMQIEGSVNQAESGEFRVGQAALVKIDAFPGLEFKGTIHSIGALAVGGYRQSQYIRTVPVRVAIHGDDPRLIPDLSGSADVQIHAAVAGVIVPLGAVGTEQDASFVYVKNADKFDKRPVEISMRNATHAAIASGLQPGEVVRLN